MNACGLIVEYNPFHNGHAFHIHQAKKLSGADCMIAIMSGSFLQRGEPAIIDKFHRTKAALQSGIDIVVELPYVFAVQNSDIFARGSVQILHEIGVSSICFGSESGSISDFITSFDIFKEKEPIYNETLHSFLSQGLSFPKASKFAYQKIGLTTDAMDLSKPNNILGYSYVKAILEYNLPIKPLTIKRSKNNFHDQSITNQIASATSIRNELINHGELTSEIRETLPKTTADQLQLYQNTTSIWHTWEKYFQFLHYRVMTMSLGELAAIHGVDEGLEHRIKKTAKEAISFDHWVQLIKTKRYTWTRIQRMFVHILTNTKKTDIQEIQSNSKVPYIRLLGMTEKGQRYLNERKKHIQVPIISKLKRNMPPMLSMEEKATNAYYSVLSPKLKQKFINQERQVPILL